MIKRALTEAFVRAFVRGYDTDRSSLSQQGTTELYNLKFNETYLQGLLRFPSSLKILNASSKSLSLNDDTKEIAVSGLELEISESKDPKQPDPVPDEFLKTLKSFNIATDTAIVTVKCLSPDEKAETVVVKLEHAKANLEEKYLASEKMAFTINGGATVIIIINAKFSLEQGFIAEEVLMNNALSKFDDVMKLCCAAVWNLYKSFFERSGSVSNNNNNNNDNNSNNNNNNNNNSESKSLFPRIKFNIGKVTVNENARESFNSTQEKIVTLRKFPESLLEDMHKELCWKNLALDKLDSMNIGSISFVFGGFDNLCIDVKGVQVTRKVSDVEVPFFKPPSFIANDSVSFDDEKSPDSPKELDSRDRILSYIGQKIRRKESANASQTNSTVEDTCITNDKKKYVFTVFELTVESVSSTAADDGSDVTVICDPFGLDCRISVFQSDRIRDPKKSVAALLKEGEIGSEEEVPVISVDLNVVGKLRVNRKLVDLLRKVVESFAGQRLSSTLTYQKDLSRSVYTKTKTLNFSLASAFFSLFRPQAKAKSYRLHVDTYVSEIEVYSGDDDSNVWIKDAESTVIRPPDVPASISSGGIFGRIDRSRFITKFRSVSGKFPKDGIFFQNAAEENGVPTIFAVDVDPDARVLNVKMSGLDVVASSERVTFLEFVKSKFLSPDSLFIPGLVPGLERISIDMYGCNINNVGKVGETSVSVNSAPQDDTRVNLLRLKRMTDIVDIQARFAAERRALEISNHGLSEENRRLKKQVSELQLENLRLRQGAETKDMLVESMSAEKVVRDEQIQMLKKENEELKNKFVFSGVKKGDVEKLRFLESKNQSLSEAIVENSVKYNKVLNENIGLKSSVANLRKQNEELLFSTKADSSTAFFDERAKKYEEEIGALREKIRDLAVLSLSFDFLFAKHKALKEKFYKQGASCAHRDHATAFFNFQNGDPAVDVPEKKRDFMRSGQVNTEVVPVSEVEGMDNGDEERGAVGQTQERQEDAKKGGIATIFRMKLFNKGDSGSQQVSRVEESEFAKKAGLPFYRNVRYMPKIVESSDTPNPDTLAALVTVAEDKGDSVNAGGENDGVSTSKSTNPFLDDDDEKEEKKEIKIKNEINKDVSKQGEEEKKKSEEDSKGPTSIFGGLFGTKKNDDRESSNEDRSQKKQKSIFENIFGPTKSEQPKYDETNPFSSPPPKLPPKETNPTLISTTPSMSPTPQQQPQQGTSSSSSSFFSFKDMFAHAFDSNEKSNDEIKKGEKNVNKETSKPTPKRMSRKNAILHALMDDDDEDNEGEDNSSSANNDNNNGNTGAIEDIPPALPPKPPKKKM